MSDSSAPSKVPKYRCRVRSDLDLLDRLNSRVKWTPSSAHVRPSPSTKALKAAALSAQLGRYRSERDFVLAEVFGLGATPGEKDGLLEVKNAEAAGEEDPPPRRNGGDVAAPPPKLLCLPNLYPYDLPDGTKHWVCWYLPPHGPASFAEADVVAAIEAAIKKEVGCHERFDFIFYENPKMNMPAVYHTQVFWHSW